VVDGVPVMLLDDRRQTMELASTSLRQSIQPGAYGELYVESLGLSDQEKEAVIQLATSKKTNIDPVVSCLVGATNGIAYRHLIGRLNEYPIPELRLPPSDGQVFLDLGCNWGRWCIAAARKGYTAVGIDPSLGAVMAAKRTARQLGIEAAYLVGDARFLPFKDSVIDRVFSYSVLQHFSRDDVALVVSDMSRVLKEKGMAFIQMPTKFGVRCLYHQARRGFRDGVGFDVRYWSLPSLSRLFSSKIGPTKFSVDCFFGIGLQFSDVRLMPPVLKIVLSASEALRLASRIFRPLVWAADSVYVSSIKSR
jgi:SAM-dependent methyltransferase